MLSAKKTYDGKIAGLYDLEETLGRGHFAVVKLARHVFTGEKVAVKVIDKTKLDEVSRAHLFQEVRCMKLVQHPNVVRLYEVIDTQTKLYLILELGDGGDLYDYIMKHETGLGEDMAKEYFRQIVRAISYCHQLHVVHRDLKPENVVFFERLGVVKLTDFGFSNKFCPGQKLDTSCGSLAYSAPEILLGDSYDAPAVDVWSLGVILYMLVAGQAPFQEANDSETLTMIMDCKYTFPTHVSEQCRRLIAKMLVREPEKRASLEEIASDAWLGGVSQIEYLPLVSRHELSEDDQNIIINKMVNGNIATKEEILEALDKNEYNHITATYFLLAERKLRTYRQEEAQNRIKQNETLVNLSTPSKNSFGKTRSADSSISDNFQIPSLGVTLHVPRVAGETMDVKARKCSIVQEEEDEEEYCSVVGNGQELTPPHSSLNRRGSRSEGKLNLAVQERIVEERRKEKKEMSSTTIQPANIGKINSSNDWPNKRTSPTTIRSGVSAYIPNSTTKKTGAALTSVQCLKTKPSSTLSNYSINTPLETKQLMSSPVVDEKYKKGEVISKTKTNINSSQGNFSTVPTNKFLDLENSEFSAVSLKDSATITIPVYTNSKEGTIFSPKFNTLPADSITKSNDINCCISENKLNNKGSGNITIDQRRNKFHKARTASCSSSDASDDDSESRKKRAHKLPLEKNFQRRDSHDDSSDNQGGSGGVSGNSGAGSGSRTNDVQNQNQSSGSSQNRTEGENGNCSNDKSNQKQCHGETYRRSRRRAGETRLRESQSLNRIMEVQEIESSNSTSGKSDPLHERIKKKNFHDIGKSLDGDRSDCMSNSLGKAKSGKSLGARFLQSWSNTVTSTKFSVQKRKHLGRRGDEEINEREVIEDKMIRSSEQMPNHFLDEKENKAVIQREGKKVKILGRYFQVSKKLCLPIPNLSSKGRLYKARSCGSISKDKISPPFSSCSSTLKPTSNGVIRNINKTHNLLMNQSLDSVLSNKHNLNSSKIVANDGKDVKNGNELDKLKSNTASPEIFKHLKIKNHTGDVNKNVGNGTEGSYGKCPSSGNCQIHLREAGKCHLS